MPHVSNDGLARPPYVNVAFQQEEIGPGGGERGLLLVVVGYHPHMCTLSIFFPVLINSTFSDWNSEN